MPDTTADTCQSSPLPAGPYLSRLQREDRDAYQATSGDPDLAEEIRLMRVVLAHLSADIAANHRAMSAILNALVRAVSLQATQLARTTEIEQALLEASKLVLQEVGLDGEPAEAGGSKPALRGLSGFAEGRPRNQGKRAQDDDVGDGL